MGQLVINKERCKGCGLCVSSCPKGILKIGNVLNLKEIPVVEFNNPEKCTACAICAKRCPDYAIVEVYR